MGVCHLRDKAVSTAALFTHVHTFSGGFTRVEQTRKRTARRSCALDEYVLSFTRNSPDGPSRTGIPMLRNKEVRKAIAIQTAFQTAFHTRPPELRALSDSKI
jgi:hypothetical protein